MIGKRLADRYEIVGELGRGGMAVVYRAHDPRLDREVAIKKISCRDLDAEATQRFQHEARVVAALDHPAIVPIFDFGEAGDDLFFVMPVLAGETLHSLLRGGDLARVELLEVIAQVADALDYAAARGVVHRDVKPENIMVARGADEGDRPRAWMMDFGVAVALAGRPAEKGDPLPGTLAYLSPEQVLSGPVDGRSDIYSLATILFEGLYGTPPFTGPPGSVLYRIVHEQPRARAGSKVEPELEKLVLAALSKEADERPHRGRDLANALRIFSGAAPPPPAPEVPHRSERQPLMGPLVGRSEELGEVIRRLERALGGECQLVAIGGDPGMGKSRLLLELERVARDRGIRVLRGRFPENEGAFPYQAFGELFQDFFRASSSPRTAGGAPDMSDLAAGLLTLFPPLREVRELAEPSWGGGLPWRGEQGEVFELVARTLARVGAGRPLVLAIENLHGADVSLELVRYLVGRLGSTPTLIAGTYRTTEVSKRHPLLRLLAGFKDHGRVSHVVLAPLGRDDHRRLIGSLIGGARVTEELARQLFEATDGNPFFTQELVRTLTKSGEVAEDETGAWTLSGETLLATGKLPETIQEVVASRVSRLPEALREALATAAVLGRSFALQDLEVLLGDPRTTDDAVDRLIRQGFLEEDRRRRGDGLGFVSGVVRDVLYGNLPRRRRRALHRRYAEYLERRFAGRLDRVYPKLVVHYSEAEVADKTVEFARRVALASLAAHSAEDAVHAVRLGLELVDDDELAGEGSEAVEGELRWLLARAQRALGHLDPALHEAGQAARLLLAGGRPEEALAAMGLAAATAWQARKIDAARRWVEEGIELADRGSDAVASAVVRRELRQLLVLGATVANLRGDPDRAGAWLARAGRFEAASSSPSAPTGGELVIGLISAPTRFDPALTLSAEEAEVLGNVYEPLIGASADGYLEPLLAIDWSGSRDDTWFELRLRPAARFSDGRLLDAAGVKAALERGAAAGSEHPAPAWRALAGSDAFLAGEASDIAGIEVLSEEQLRFRLGEPLPIFPAMLTDPRTALARVAGDGRLVGTGPFCLAEVGGRGPVLERNPFREVPPALDRVIVRGPFDSRGLAAALRSGQVDVARDLQPEDLDRLLATRAGGEGVSGTLVRATRRNIYALLFNTQGPRARDLKLRRAIHDAVDVADIVWRTLGRFAEPATSWIPPGLIGHSQAAGGRIAAPEGFPSPVPAGRAIRLRALAHPLFLDRYRALTDALLTAWQAIGVEVDLEPLNLADLMPRLLDSSDVDLVLSRWLPDYLDPDDFTYGPFHSQRGLYRALFSSPELDEVLERARRARAGSAREAGYQQFARMAAEECAFLPLFHDIDFRVAGPRAGGVELRSSPQFLDYSRLVRLPDRAAAAAARRGQLQVPIIAQVSSLEPGSAALVEQAEVIPNVFETLTRVDEGAHLAPFLASSFVAEEGGRRYRVRLRDNIRWHDGAPLSTADVGYSLERLLRTAPAMVVSRLLAIRGARAYRARESESLAGLRVVDERELILELDRPVSILPAIFSRPATAIVRAGCVRFDSSWRDGCVGTGPFRVLRVGESRIELAANPDYWREGLPRCERLSFVTGVDPAGVADDFRAGRLSLASNLPRGEIDALRRDPELASGYREAPGFSTYYLAWNNASGPLADRDCRRALSAALDVDRLVGAHLPGLGIPAGGLIPPGLLGYDAAAPPAPPPEREVDLRGLELVAAIHSVFAGELAEIWQGIVAQLAARGVEIRVVATETTEMLAASDREVDLIASRWFGDYPDADTFVGLFHSDHRAGTLHAPDPELDRLIEEARAETDAALRHTLYREIERLLARQALLRPLFHEQAYRFARPEVDGLRLRFRMPEVAYEELSVR